MAGFVEGTDHGQVTLFPARLEDYVAEDNPVRAVDVFVDGLDFDKLGFIRVQPLDLGRPGYDPRMMLKLYIHAYLDRVPSSRRLERECQRNIEVIWLTGQKRDRSIPLVPGQAHDMKGVAPLIHDVSLGALLADKAFDADWLLQDLDGRGATAVILPKANRRVQRDYDIHMYRCTCAGGAI